MVVCSEIHADRQQTLGLLYVHRSDNSVSVPSLPDSPSPHVPPLRLSRFSSGSDQSCIIAKIAGPGRKRHNSDPDPSSGSDSGDGRPVSAKCLKMSSGSGGETVGRRGGGHQRGGGGGGGGRENSTDLATNTSKKKQKDRANQESREAKRAAAAVDGVIAEVKKGELDSAPLAQRHVCFEMCDREGEEWLLGITLAGQMERFLNPLVFFFI